MKFMMSTLLTLLAFAFFVCCSAFFAGCAKSVSEPEPEPDPVEVILRHQPPAEKEPLQQEEEERQKEKERQLQRETNRKTIEEILEMQRQQRKKLDEIAKQHLKDAHALIFKLERMRAPDRSIPAVIKALKPNLNNPDSFQHIKTTIMPIRQGNTYHVLVRVHYRATNAYGGLVKTSSEFRYNTKGRVISAK